MKKFLFNSPKSKVIQTAYLLFAFCLTRCDSPDNNLYKFDPGNLKENKIPLSEIADDVDYVPLENSIPVGVVTNVRFINKTVYFHTKDIGILAFDRETNKLRKIGVMGRSPGEYLYSNVFTVDEATGTVYILDKNNIIKIFSGTGQFIKSFPLKEDGVGDAIEFYNSMLFVSYAIQFANGKYK